MAGVGSSNSSRHVREFALQVLSAKARFVKLVIEGKIVIRRRSAPDPACTEDMRPRNVCTGEENRRLGPGMEMGGRWGGGFGQRTPGVLL